MMQLDYYFDLSSFGHFNDKRFSDSDINFSEPCHPFVSSSVFIINLKTFDVFNREIYLIKKILSFNYF